MFVCVCPRCEKNKREEEVAEKSSTKRQQASSLSNASRFRSLRNIAAIPSLL